MLKSTECPVCKNSVLKNSNAPFCSKRCQMIDLGKWAKEEYVIPSQETVRKDPEDIN